MRAIHTDAKNLSNILSMRALVLCLISLFALNVLLRMNAVKKGN